MLETVREGNVTLKLFGGLLPLFLFFIKRPTPRDQAEHQRADLRALLRGLGPRLRPSRQRVLVRGGDWYLPVLRGSTSTPGRRVLRTRGPAHDHGPKEGGQGERPAGTAALQAPRPLRRAPNDLTASPACAVWCKGAVPCLL